MWSRVAISSAMRMGLPKGSSSTPRPMRRRRVRAAMAAATVTGADSTLKGMKWYSASQTDSMPSRSASSAIWNPC